MSSKVSSLEEKVKLPPTETISRCYQPPGKNRKVIRILTVAVYVLCVSLAAIMLSLYYIFIWDPTIRPFVTKGNQCDKIVIPEKIAIRLLNSSEVTAEQFYKHILEQYRLLNQLQQQRQQFLQKQHIHLQQLAAANKFQEIFATATIIQANAHDPLRKPITPTNGTFLLDPSQPIVNSLEPRIPILDTAQAPIPVLAPASALATALSSSSSSSSSSAALAAASASNGHTKRKSHRKHYNNNNHHRHTSRKNHRKSTAVTGNGNGNNNADNNNNSNNDYEPEPFVVESPPMNPPILSVVQEPYTQLPIPLVLNSREDKRPIYYTHSERRGGSGGARKRAGYETQTYMNPLLTGELIFEK
ncbi:uncharacterized protein DDB_G0286175 isoform X1 [Bactrocera tryoni]|uniref:uncharacterized protein DDB_G0286175 isoform X1 n=1 Tax=Bactrocera tryoni TaxID=59916 RepID=UPI001A980D5A|nr:uncharacterized protein DDB_G0286175 isoform X1 [Bactrocera tryoni]XP_039959288.1 uncharacterized protein DDB_G0286175 isoform X1 [Bactrocera tryoni]XP_039959289.1 uncharacterized protein DDB_G0286175 isoform X1 [Bactrocera tryoni]